MVITGASAGIGRATAVRLARDGAALVICARRRAPLEAAADEIRGAGGDVLAVTADVTREAEMDALVASAVDRFGRLDVMMCNAGFGIYGSIDQMKRRACAAARRELHGHVPGGTRRAARFPPPAERSVDHRLVDRRQARHSVHGAYAATKFAQVGLAESLRAELRGSGIHVTVVYPISTRTEFFDVMTRSSGFATRAEGPQQDAAAVADAIARAIAAPAAEVFPFRTARLLGIVNAMAPRFTDRLVQRWGRKPV